MSVKVSVGGGTQVLPNARDVQKRIDAARTILTTTYAGGPVDVVDPNLKTYSHSINETAGNSLITAGGSKGFLTFTSANSSQYASRLNALKDGNNTSLRYSTGSVYGNVGFTETYMVYEDRDRLLEILKNCTMTLGGEVLVVAYASTASAYLIFKTQVVYQLKSAKLSPTLELSFSGSVMGTGAYTELSRIGYTLNTVYPMNITMRAETKPTSNHSLSLSDIPLLDFAKDDITIRGKYHYLLSTSDSGGTHLAAKSEAAQGTLSDVV